MIFKEVEIDRRVVLVVYNLNGRKHRLKGVIGGGTNIIGIVLVRNFGVGVKLRLFLNIGI